MSEPIAPEGYELVHVYTADEMLANNVAAAVTYMSTAVAHTRYGGELTKGATANLKIIRRWAEMLLAGEIPQPGDGVSE